MTTEKTFSVLSQLLVCCEQPQSLSDTTFLLTTKAETGSLVLATQLKEADIYPAFRNPNLRRDLDDQKNRNIPAGEEIEVEVPRSVRSLVVAKDLDSLLRCDRARERLPSGCIILPEKGVPFWFTQETEPSTLPAHFTEYCKAIELWSLLEGLCHHKDSSDSLIFYGQRRVEMAPVFHATDLCHPIQIEKLRRFVRDADKEEVKREIFLSVISDLAKDHGPDTAFRFLLTRTGLLAQRLQEGLSVFLATNSPKKLVDEARSQAIGLSEKLEKIVSSLELKGLAVPAAMVLSVKEVEKGAGWTGLNLVLIFSTGLFFLAMLIVYRSQAAMMDPLKASIRHSRQDFKERGLDENNADLGVTFEGLLARIGITELASRVVVAASLLPVLAVFVAAVAPKGTSDKASLTPPVIKDESNSKQAK